MKKQFSMWLLTFAVLCAFSGLSFAQEAPAAVKNTAAESIPSANTGKTNKKEKKTRKPRKTHNESKKGTGK